MHKNAAKSKNSLHGVMYKTVLSIREAAVFFFSFKAMLKTEYHWPGQLIKNETTQLSLDLPATCLNQVA